MVEKSFDFVNLAVEVILALVIIFLISRFMTIGNQMTNSLQRELDIANFMAEYGMYSKYDDTLLSGSDVVEAIHMYAESDVIITVVSSGIGTFTYTSGDIDLATLNTQIYLVGSYRSSLQFDANNTIRGIRFISN